MLSGITETKVPITLDKEYILYFNANTMVAYEEATKKNFMATVDSLFKVYSAAMKPGGGMVTTMELLRSVSMSELTALVWAALHTYDDNDEPSWPLTIAQVRRMISLNTIPNLFLNYLRGQASNSPTAAEMGESQALSETSEKETTSAAPKPNGKDGGERSIALPEDAFT